MIRLLLTALAIIGMVLQPIAFARSAEWQIGGIDQQMVSSSQFEMDDHAMMSQMSDDDMPCHEAKTKPNTDCGTCCDADYSMTEHCRISSSQAPVLFLKIARLIYSHISKIPPSSESTGPHEGIPDFIDHPPKHA